MCGMQRPPSIGSIRNATLTRLCAAAIILLVALPFTAPFSICDAAELAGNTSGHADASTDAKVCHEVRIGAILCGTITLLPLTILVQHDGGLTARVGTHTPVLRL
jgi:hypothetical protein